MKANPNKKRRRIEPEQPKRYVEHIDYKDIKLLESMITPHGKMFGSKKSAYCAKNQRQLTRAIKRARFLGLLPYIGTTVKD